MIDVRDHRHVTDVGLLVHDGTDLVDCEVHLRSEEIKILCHNAKTILAVESPIHWLKSAVLNSAFLYKSHVHFIYNQFRW